MMMSRRRLGLLLFVLWICGGGVAHAAPLIAVSPPDFTFPDTRVNDGAATPKRTTTFTISNTNNMTLMVTAIAFSLADYRLNPPVTLPLMITNGAPQTITVEFNPSAIGTRSATMTLTNNSTNAPSKTVDLTGEGTAAVIAVPDPIAFGIVNNGSASQQSLTIQNTTTTSQGPLTVTSATITGSTFFHFGNTLGCTGGTTCTFSPALVIPGGTTTLPVFCQPPATASGNSSATLTFTSDTDASGDGTTTLTCTAGRSDIAVNASTLNFVNLAVGQAQDQVVTITNNGNIPLTYDLSEVPDVMQFAITTGCSSSCSIPAAPPPPSPPNTATFTLRFTPNSPAQVTTHIQIANNDPDSVDNPTSITINGTGHQGVIATDPTTLAFGGVAQGSTKTLPFLLQNTGNVNITNIRGTLANPNLGFQLDPTTPVPTTLNQGQQISINVIFAPTIGTADVATNITFTAEWSADGRNASTMAVLQLTGTGQTTGNEVSPAMLPFGDFRFDARPTLSYQIRNTAQANLTVNVAADFVPDPPTTISEFAFAVTKNGTPVALTPAPVLGPNEHLDVAVTPQPNNRIGALSGRVTIRTSMSPDRQVTLSGNAITAGISVPSTVDFGGVDIDAAPASQTIKLTNSGAATLDILSITKMAGGSPAFTVTPLPTTRTTVAPGADFTLDVTYAPTVARAMNQPETLVLDASLAGIVPGPSHAMITIQGRGIDRVLTLDAMGSFPDTFRNPGGSAPVQAITVRNTGEAPLKITALMISDDPATGGERVWQLVDPRPVEISGLDHHDFLVRFAPKQIDDATHTTPHGHLVLINDDNARPMAAVDLTGKCIERSVEFGPSGVPSFEIGQIGVGIPTAVDLPPIVNLDRVGFTIRAIGLSGDQVFQLDRAPRDVELPVGATQRFTMTVEPTTPGTVHTTVQLYLDQDPEPHRELTFTATAVFVEAHGGGGCNAGRARTGGGAAIALGALTAFAARRRRRCRPRRGVAERAITGAIVAIAALTTPARADDVGVTVFAPTPATTGTGFQLQSPDVGIDGNWTASSVLSYASNLLVLDGQGPSGPFHVAPVERSTLVQLGFAYALYGRFEVGIHLPLFMQSGQADGTGQTSAVRVEPASGTALGNLALHGKAHLWRGDTALGELVAGASASAIIPTASSGQFTGSDKLEMRALLLGSLAPRGIGSRLTVSINAGPIVRGEARYANISERSGIAWGLGATYRVLDPLWATAELFGEATPSGRRTQPSADPAMTGMLVQSEWLAGVSFKVDQRFTVGAAIGRGVTDAIGTPDLRGMASIAFTPHAPAIAPIPVEVPKPDGDSDGDGIRDSVDKCRNEPEDSDGFEDSDGCPDLDNDRDGIPDANDRCPDQPEDKDGFEDGDGCPDLDNDRDGIPDARDRCPDQPEDKDGFEDNDGCPDPDNDRDGIPDARDRCPNEPETVNGKDDDDGCPDELGAVDGNDQRAAIKAAEDTFNRGLELLQQRRYTDACAAFEQSQRLDPQFGTQYQIAGCYTKIGRLATAWNMYRELARSDSNPKRRPKAGIIAGTLAPRVPRIRIVMRKKPTGVQVLMNGVNATALIGVDTPVDFGNYAFVATATGYREWRKTVDVKEEGKIVTVVIDLVP